MNVTVINLNSKTPQHFTSASNMNHRNMTIYHCWPSDPRTLPLFSLSSFPVLLQVGRCANTSDVRSFSSYLPIENQLLVRWHGCLRYSRATGEGATANAGWGKVPEEVDAVFQYHQEWWRGGVFPRGWQLLQGKGGKEWKKTSFPSILWIMRFYMGVLVLASKSASSKFATATAAVGEKG